MWLFDRAAILALPLVLAACGFSPAFAPGGPAGQLRGTIALADTTTRNGFEFIKHFEDRLGRVETARYDLTTSIAASAVSLGTTGGGSVTRFNLLGSVTWSLADRATGNMLASGVEQNFVGWSLTGVTISAVNAESDANSRLMRILADMVVARLIALSPTLAPAP